MTQFDVRWQRAVVDIVGVEEAGMPSPAAWSVPLSRKSNEDMRWWEAFVHVRRDTTAGMHAQMRMLGELMELKDCVVKGFTLAFFFLRALRECWKPVTGQAALPRLPGRLGEERVDGEKLD